MGPLCMQKIENPESWLGLGLRVLVHVRYVGALQEI